MNLVSLNRPSNNKFGNNTTPPFSKQIDRGELQEKLLARLAPRLDWALNNLDKRVAQKDYTDAKSEDIMAHTIITNMTTLLTTIYR